jgi:hypothetical protein
LTTEIATVTSNISDFLNKYINRMQSEKDRLESYKNIMGNKGLIEEFE